MIEERGAELGPPERLHPLALLASIGSSLRNMWGIFVAGGYFAIQGRWGIVFAALAIFTVFSLLRSVIRWHKLSFRVGTREIRIDSGFLNRTHRSIPFDRIQDVTIEQGPLARALGLARVGFETGGSGGSHDDEGALAAITLVRANEIRELVRASRELGQSPSAAAVPVESEEAPVFAMDLKRVLLAGLFNFSLAVVGFLFGASQTVGQVVGFDPFDESFWRGLFAAGSPIADYVLAHRVATLIAGSLLLVLLGLGTGLLRTLMREYGFRLDRRETALRRRRGLITLTDVSLPLKRIQAAAIGSGPVRARFGWSELTLQSLAMDEAGKGEHVVAPLADEPEIDRVLDAIGYRPLRTPLWRRVSSAYVWVLMVGLSPLFLIAILQLMLFGVAPFAIEGVPEEAITALAPAVAWSALMLLVLLGAVALRWLGWRRYGYALDGDRLIVRLGWLRRRIRILPLRNIQSVDYSQSFVGRWFGMANLAIGVAGGSAASHGVNALPAETARALRNDLLSRYA